MTEAELCPLTGAPTQSMTKSSDDPFPADTSTGDTAYRAQVRLIDDAYEQHWVWRIVDQDGRTVVHGSGCDSKMAAAQVALMRLDRAHLYDWHNVTWEDGTT